jgi:hypothetical protein
MERLHANVLGHLEHGTHCLSRNVHDDMGYISIITFIAMLQMLDNALYARKHRKQANQMMQDEQEPNYLFFTLSRSFLPHLEGGTVHG